MSEKKNVWTVYSTTAFYAKAVKRILARLLFEITLLHNSNVVITILLLLR